MGNKQTHEIVLTAEERDFLIKNAKKSSWSPREIKRAQILLKADKNGAGMKDREIAAELFCSQYTITKLRERFAKERLGVIHDKERSGRPKIANGDVEAHIIAIACSEAPAGKERWTLRLLAERIVTLVDLESCSYGTVRNVLKKTNSSLGKENVENPTKSKWRICLENGISPRNI